MKRYLWGLSLNLFISAIVAASPAWGLDFDKPIIRINTEGLDRADKNTVRFYIHTKTGSLYDVDSTREDIKRVFALGFFDDIKLNVTEEEEGLVLTYIFKEKPFVRNITLFGVGEVSEDVIQARVKTKKGTFFRQDQAPWDQERIRRIYRNKGYYFSEVRTVVIKLDQNQVDVEFHITEGKKISVGKVIFRGVNALSKYTLENVIETKAAGSMSYFSDGSAFKKDVLKTDVLRMESVYHDNGFLKVKVYDPEVEIDKEKRQIYVSFSVSEGEMYRVGEIRVKSDDVYSEEELLKKIKLQKGDVFNRSQFRKDIFSLTDLYSQKGYAFASISPKMELMEETKTVDVEIEPKKGRKVYVGKITISGNETTRDRVIRRQFKLNEGELFDSSKLRRSRQRVSALGFFETVDIEQRSRREEDLMDVEVKVIERNTGQISFAVGYSSIENLILQGQLKWSNLFGRGQRLSFTIDYSSLRNDFSLSFTEPGLFDRQLLAGADVSNKTFEFDTYNSRTTGGSLRVGRALGEYVWGKVGYKFEENEVTLRDSEDVNVFLQEQEGVNTTGTIFPSLTYDSRNDRFNPSAGQRIHGYLEVAGLGGTDKFYKLIGEYTGYKPLWLGLVGMFHAKIGWGEGYGEEDLPIYKRFFLGGARSLRGFSFRDIGPKTESGEVIGGEALLQFNTELQYAFTRYFRGFLFYDRGNVYGSNDELGNTTDDYYNLEEMRHSWGFGIHFFSPIGPISMAYGFKLDQRVGEPANEFHFTVGGAF